ncbi:MAG: CHAT domain-containing protein [Rhizobiales bacterium]|nr:CHAT domain-containing protein [Hyphomicrobiales bacterium]
MNLMAVALIAIALWCAISNAHAAYPERTCDPDAKYALAAAAEFHELAERELYQARGIDREDQVAAELDRLARLYVLARARSALVIYAWNDTDFCLFLWLNRGPSTPFNGLRRMQEAGDIDHSVFHNFVRLPGARRGLLENIDALRDTIFAWTSGSARSPRKRGVLVAEAPVAPGQSLAQASHDVARTLFPPDIKAELADAAGLTIVPVGPISTVPLAMLEPLDDGRAAIELFTINIISKLDDLKSIGFGWAPGFSAPLIFGNPVTHDAEWEFPELPGAEREARLAHALFGGRLAMGEEATVELFGKAAPGADLIIIAAHGIADAENPIEKSFLALSDGRLTPRKIQAQPYRGTPIVVLSACQSGLGRAMDAGIMGIARSFQVMGAANTIMSLWNVDDEATMFLMSGFYRRLADLGPNSALRQAILDTRQRYPEPAKWAAFLVFGNPVVPPDPR